MGQLVALLSHLGKRVCCPVPLGQVGFMSHCERGFAVLNMYSFESTFITKTQIILIITESPKLVREKLAAVKPN